MIDFFGIPQAIARRMDTANKYALRRIGEDIARIGSLNNYKDAQLIAVRMTGESIAEITRELSKASGMTESDIEKLYADAARYDYEFAEQFYTADNPQIPYRENEALQRTVKAMTKAAQDNCYNLSHSYAFALRDRDGRVRYTSLAAGYKECIDKAITAVKTGVSDYKTEMRRVLKQYADSGVRVVDWESGYSQRIDTAVRRNIMDGLRQVKNETQTLIGQEFGANGYEISAHMNPAPDHADIQGRQYSFEEFNELNESLERPIGTLNCYHTKTAIILGISRPTYTEEQLQEMKRKSNELIDIDGKKYTRYQCTQLQRQIETKIRKQKDRKEILKAAGDDVGVRECNRKIRLLKDKYNEISQKAGLDTHYDRMSVVKSTNAANEATKNTFAPTYYNSKYNYKITLSGYSDEVNNGLSKAAHNVAKLGSDSRNEHLNLVNLNNGKISYTEIGDGGSVGYAELWKYLKAHPNESFAFVHNHNNDTFFSETDMRTLLTNNQIPVMIAVRNDSVIYIAERTKMLPNVAFYHNLYSADLEEINRLSRSGKITPAERTVLVEETIVNNLLRDYTKGLVEIDGRK